MEGRDLTGLWWAEKDNLEKLCGQKEPSEPVGKTLTWDLIVSGPGYDTGFLITLGQAI